MASAWPMSPLPGMPSGPAPATRRAARRVGRYVPCSDCGKPMIHRGAERPACKICRQNPPPRICDLCEESYVPRPKARPDQRFCSKSCKTAWQMGARPPFQRRTVTGMALKIAQARKRRLHHAQTWDGITDEEILERDGWRCGICRKVIGKKFKCPHPRSKSIDHIIPLVHGGDDTAVNKRAAHLGCNLARGDKMGDEQVALFGSLREPPLATVTAGERSAIFQPRKRRVCPCGAAPLKSSKFCQVCFDRREAEARTRAGPASSVYYFTCRYCGELKVARRAAREVCPARTCQLARLAANNLRTRQEMTAEEADVLVREQVAAARGPGYGRWRRGAA
jgi:HNH endonuclease